MNNALQLTGTEEKDYIQSRLDYLDGVDLEDVATPQWYFDELLEEMMADTYYYKLSDFE